MDQIVFLPVATPSSTTMDNVSVLLVPSKSTIPAKTPQCAPMDRPGKSMLAVPFHVPLDISGTLVLVFSMYRPVP